jgi:hypothetical protein
MTDQDRCQNAPQPASAGHPSRETAGPGSTVTEQRTPCPWFAVWNGNYWEINIDDDQYAHTVAAVWARVPGLRVGAEADARLIAAAPDMLTACKHALTIVNEYEASPTGYAGTIVLRKLLEDAIAKAEGRS